MVFLFLVSPIPWINEENSESSFNLIQNSRIFFISWKTTYLSAFEYVITLSCSSRKVRYSDTVGVFCSMHRGYQPCLVIHDSFEQKARTLRLSSSPMWMTVSIPVRLWKTVTMHLMPRCILQEHQQYQCSRTSPGGVR